MKLFKNPLVLALSVALGTSPLLYAASSVQHSPMIASDAVAAKTVLLKRVSDKNAPALVETVAGKTVYFIHLHDEPLATYKGDKKGFLATSLQFNEDNRTHKGKININSVASRAYLSHLKQTQHSLLSQASVTLGRELTDIKKFHLAVNAFSTPLSDKEAAQLRTLPQVKSVIASPRWQLQTMAGPKHMGAGKIWQGVEPDAGTQGAGILVAIFDTGISPFSPSFTDKTSDGYDHTNPWGTVFNKDPMGIYNDENGNALGGCTTHPEFCNDKVIGIYAADFFTEWYTGLELPPVGIDYHSHGSHVASTVAGNHVTAALYNYVGAEGEFKVNLSGVAPQANIVSYQVCSPFDGCYGQATVQAIEHAISIGVDVINYSVGGPGANSWENTASLAFLAAREAGIHVAVAASNNGPVAQTLGSPGNAPWVTGVAASTHDLGYRDITLSEFTGGEQAPISLSGKGVTKGLASTNVVYAGDFDEYAADDAKDGQCLEPFAEGTFNGEIVVCKRGEIARVQKSNNVAVGGAGGFVLANMDEAQLTYADPHEIAGININKADGEALLTWLSSGENHMAAISSTEQISDPEAADIIAAFSSRGPNFAPRGRNEVSALDDADVRFENLFSPSISAPGVNIYAANAHSNELYMDGGEARTRPADEFPIAPYVHMSGTSMASPHVAGALALLKALRPNWTPAQMQSAVMTTGIQNMQANAYNEEGTAVVKNKANFHDMGAGRIDILQASRAGLLLDISAEQYRDAKPFLADGSAAKLMMHELNSAGLSRYGCVIECNWTRTLSAVKAGKWTVSFESLSEGIEISADKSSITLDKGQAVTLNIMAESNGKGLAWQFGNVVLTPEDSGLAVQRLPIAGHFTPGTSPENVTLTVNSDRGELAIGPFVSAGAEPLQLALSGLAKAKIYHASLIEDVTPENVIDEVEDGSWHHIPVTIPPRTKALKIDIISAEALDLDMYIGPDDNHDGILEPRYEMRYGICISATESALETCYLENPRSGQFVIAIQNFTASSAGALDKHTVAVTIIPEKDSGGMFLTSPEVTPKVEFDITARFGLPMAEGDIYYGVVTAGTNLDAPENLGDTLVELIRGPSLVTITTGASELVAGEAFSYDITLAANDGTAREVLLEVSLPADWTLSNLPEGADFNNGVFTWTVSQPANSDAVNFTLTPDTSNSAGIVETALVISYHIGADRSVGQSIAPTVTVEALPVALINGTSVVSQSVQELMSVTFSTATSFSSIEGDSLSYHWTQISGPSVALTMHGDNVTFNAPEVSRMTRFSYQLTVDNGRNRSAPATVNIQVSEKPSSSGGAMFWLFPLLALSLRKRR